jgi:hypothetical protein
MYCLGSARPICGILIVPPETGFTSDYSAIPAITCGGDLDQPEGLFAIDGARRSRLKKIVVFRRSSNGDPDRKSLIDPLSW